MSNLSTLPKRKTFLSDLKNSSSARVSELEAELAAEKRKHLSTKAQLDCALPSVHRCKELDAKAKALETATASVPSPTVEAPASMPSSSAKPLSGHARAAAIFADQIKNKSVSKSSASPGAGELTGLARTAAVFSKEFLK